MADAFAIVLWLKTDGTGSFVLHHGNDDRMRAFRVEESKCSIHWKESTAYKTISTSCRKISMHFAEFAPSCNRGGARCPYTGNKQIIHVSSLKARSTHPYCMSSPSLPRDIQIMQVSKLEALSRLPSLSCKFQSTVLSLAMWLSGLLALLWGPT